MNGMAGILHFAYGSNLDSAQMRKRCPSNRVLEVAVLRNYTLAFTRFARRRGCGVADVVPELGAVVWGRLYELTQGDLDNLDQAEGANGTKTPPAYHRLTLMVEKGGDPSQLVPAEVYVVPVADRGSYLPNQTYMDLILRGAREANLPPDYQAWLRSLPVA